MARLNCFGFYLIFRKVLSRKNSGKRMEFLLAFCLSKTYAATIVTTDPGLLLGDVVQKVFYYKLIYQMKLMLNFSGGCVTKVKKLNICNHILPRIPF